MNALVSRLTRKGVRLAGQEGAFKVSAPPGVLTDDDKAALSASRDDLIRLVARADQEEARVNTLIGRASAAVRGDPASRHRSTPRLNVLAIYAEVVRDLRDNLDPLLFEAGASVEGLVGRWGLPLGEGQP